MSKANQMDSDKHGISGSDSNWRTYPEDEEDDRWNSFLISVYQWFYFLLKNKDKGMHLTGDQEIVVQEPWDVFLSVFIRVHPWFLFL